MAIDTITKHPVGLTQSDILTLIGTHLFWLGQNEGRGDFVCPTGVPYYIQVALPPDLTIFPNFAFLEH